MRRRYSTDIVHGGLFLNPQLGTLHRNHKLITQIKYNSQRNIRLLTELTAKVSIFLGVAVFVLVASHKVSEKLYTLTMEAVTACETLISSYQNTRYVRV
jgi:hypothetical protein